MTVKVTLGTFAPVKEPNPYADVITQLAAAGPDAAANLEVDKASAAKTGRKFSDAANDASFTARKRAILVTEKDDEGNDITRDLLRDKDAYEALKDDATVVLVYTLGPKQERPGRPRKDAVADVVEVAPATPAPAPAKSNGKK